MKKEKNFCEITKPIRESHNKGDVICNGRIVHLETVEVNSVDGLMNEIGKYINESL